MLRLLGAPHLSGEANSVVILPAKAPALFARLALAHSGTAPRLAIATWLWEASQPTQAAGSLRMLLSALRRFRASDSAPLLRTDPSLVWRDGTCVDCDLELLLRTRDIGSEAELDRLSDLYRGPLLSGADRPLGGELGQWVEEQRSLLRDHFVSLVLAASQKLAGVAVGRALRRVAEEAPYDDAAERALLRYLAREVSADAVRREFESYRQRLRTDLQAAPELETFALVAQLVPHLAPALNASVDGPATPFAAPGTPKPAAQAGTVAGSVPRVLLLPPATGEGDQSECRLAASLIEDVTITLCRLRSFAIFAPHTARQIAAGNPFGSPSVYGADFVLGTSILPGRDHDIRLGMSFTRVSTHEVLFADEFVFSAERLPQHHADIASAIAGRVATSIERAEIASYRRTGAANAYVHFLLGQEHLQVIDLKEVRKARKAFRRASELRPDFAAALAMTSRTITLEWLLLGRRERDLLLEARRLSEQAVALDPLDAAGHRELGHVALYMHDFDASLDHLARARERAPHHADLLINEADALIHSARTGDARPLIEKAMALNPLPPDEYHWIAATAHFFEGDYHGALAAIERMQQPEPLMRLAAACAALLGDTGRATHFRERSMARQPDFRVADWKELMPLRDEAMKDQFVAALRLAGFP